MFAAELEACDDVLLDAGRRRGGQGHDGYVEELDSKEAKRAIVGPKG